MKVDKMSISLDPLLSDQVRSAADRSGMSLSGWLAEAAAAKLRQENLTDLVAEFESEHGSFTPAELADSRQTLGLDPRAR